MVCTAVSGAIRAIACMSKLAEPTGVGPEPRRAGISDVAPSVHCAPNACASAPTFACAFATQPWWLPLLPEKHCLSEPK